MVLQQLTRLGGFVNNNILSRSKTYFVSINLKCSIYNELFDHTIFIVLYNLCGHNHFERE